MRPCPAKQMPPWLNSAKSWRLLLPDSHLIDWSNFIKRLLVNAAKKRFFFFVNASQGERIFVMM